jgi:hypothetical protein
VTVSAPVAVAEWNITPKVSFMCPYRHRPGGRLAPAAARGLAHLARAVGDFPTALATARTLGWPGRGNRVLGDIHFAHGDMDQAAACFTAARAEAEQHANLGEQAIAQANLAITYAFTDPDRADDEIALAEQLLAGLDQRATPSPPGSPPSPAKLARSPASTAYATCKPKSRTPE